VSEALPAQRMRGRAAPARNQADDLHRHFYGGLGAERPDYRGGGAGSARAAAQPPLTSKIVPVASHTEAAQNSAALGVAPSAPPAPVVVPVPQLPVTTVATPVPEDGQYYSYARVELYTEGRNVY
jgi:predicted secreted protein